MHTITLRLGLVLSLLLLAACEQGYKDESKVLVKVNGEAITENAYQNYRALLQNQQQTAVEDNEQNRTILLEQMVFNRLMTQEAENQKLHLQDDVHHTLQVQREEVLIGAVARNYLKSNPVTEEEIKQRYEELKMTNEYLVRHILVSDRKQAEDIIARLKKKESFNTLAKKYSTHEQSKNKGGLIDWISPQFVAPSIYQAVDQQKKPGLIAQPVASKFGWHVVKVDKVRHAQLPPLASVRQAIGQQLQRAKISDLGQFLRKGAEIEYVGAQKK